MQAIQIIIIIFALFALSRALLRFKDSKLNKNEFFFWLLIWLAVIVLAAVPNLIGIFSEQVGIGRGMDLIIYASIIFLFYLIFRLYVRIESQEKEITALVRKIALNKNGEKKRKNNRQKKQK